MTHGTASLIGGLLAGLSILPTHADNIAYEFKGVLTAVSAQIEPFGYAQVGDPFTLTVIFDNTATDSDPSPGTYGAASAGRIDLAFTNRAISWNSASAPPGSVIYCNDKPIGSSAEDCFELRVSLPGDQWFSADLALDLAQIDVGGTALPWPAGAASPQLGLPSVDAFGIRSVLVNAIVEGSSQSLSGFLQSSRQIPSSELYTATRLTSALMAGVR